MHRARITVGPAYGSRSRELRGRGMHGMHVISAYVLADRKVPRYAWRPAKIHYGARNSNGMGMTCARMGKHQ